MLSMPSAKQLVKKFLLEALLNALISPKSFCLDFGWHFLKDVKNAGLSAAASRQNLNFSHFPFQLVSCAVKFLKHLFVCYSAYFILWLGLENRFKVDLKENWTKEMLVFCFDSKLKLRMQNPKIRNLHNFSIIFTATCVVKSNDPHKNKSLKG